jgi:hypothetical protein
MPHSRNRFVAFAAAASAAFVSPFALGDSHLPCAEDATCYQADKTGARDDSGDHVAQCKGRFPDFLVPIANIPDGYEGPFFELAQDFPEEPVPAGDLPWSGIDFKASIEDANAYLYALRDYAFEGMIDADFVPKNNPVRKWYHVPLMNFYHGREAIHGLTTERPLNPPELGLKNPVENYAVGFYNDIGAYPIGQVWKDTNNPDIAASQFPEGAMVFKILFSTATPDDFETQDILAGAPEWEVAIGKEGQLTTVRLLQMDVAVRDDRAEETGWVFGTFAFDSAANDASPWNRMKPVGLMWGDDPGYTPENQQAGDPLKESIVSNQIPAYAATHLGWAGRVNGPVDNPISSCMSCHGTAQYPVTAIMVPTSACTTDTQKLQWFENRDGQTPFGAIDRDTCEREDPPVGQRSLDFSLQVQVSVQNLLDYHDVNTCTPALEEGVMPSAEARDVPVFPRIER